MKKLLILATLCISLVLGVSPVNASTVYTSHATLEATPLALGQGDVGDASVNFGSKFATVEQVCFNFVFSQVDTYGFEATSEDELWVQFGKGRQSTLLYVDRIDIEGTQGVACTQRDSQTSRFLDGTERFGIFMERNSVIVESLTVTLTGN